MIFTFSIILFLFVVVRSIFFWLYLWQLKEYRFDRLSVHLRDTSQGKQTIFSFESTVVLLLFLVFFVSIFSDVIGNLYPFFVFAGFFVLSCKMLYEILARKFKHPVFTAKALSIFAISVFFLIVLLLFPLTDPSFWLVFLVFFIPFLVWFVIFLFAFPTEVYTDVYLSQAQKKRIRLKKLQVIAVSGSYGKSSTKEVVAQILSQKFHVVKTDFSYNTPLAIAKTILSKITDDTDFFVVELGAYKQGEIKQLAQMVKPTISITTAISDQHLALYGSMKNVILSELELIRELPRDSLVLLNGNSREVLEFAKKISQKHIVWYKASKTVKSEKNTAFGYNVHVERNGIVWEYGYKKILIHFHSSLLGLHTIENILPAVILGQYFGIAENVLQKAVKHLQPLPKTMEKIALYDGLTAIDDSFNASPESVLSAISYMNSFQQRKILILSPLIELGTNAKLRHREIGKALANIDIVFLTNKNFLQELQEGILQKNGSTKLITGSYAFIAQQLKKTMRQKDIILFEGKEAGIVLKHLL